MPRDQSTDLLRPGQVAYLLGVDVATLRVLDRQGRLKPDQRTNGGHRRYTPESVGKLLDELRRMAGGYPLPADADMLGSLLPPDQTPLFSIGGSKAGRQSFVQAVCEEAGCNWIRDLPRSLGYTPRAERLAQRLVLGHWLDDHFREMIAHGA